MAPKTHAHTHARIAATKVLYSAEICGKTPKEILAQGEFPEEGGIIDDYAFSLIEGVEQHCDELDDMIGEASTNWAVARMPIIDRCVLRLAVFEMVHVDSVPLSVSINEAVELAKAFGGEDESHRFVNGVLGRIAARLSGEDDEALPEVELPDHAASHLDADMVVEVAQSDPSDQVDIPEAEENAQVAADE